MSCRPTSGIAGVFFTTRSELQKVLFWSHQSVIFLVCMKYVGNCWTDLLFAPNSEGTRVWSLAQMSLKVKVKGQGHQEQKRSEACIEFMFGKISLASSYRCFYCCILVLLSLQVLRCDFMYFFFLISAAIWHNKSPLLALAEPHLSVATSTEWVSCMPTQQPHSQHHRK